ncbi:MAG: hypothetical protein WD628_00290, partial [Thermomicrobiales bacterium]
LAFVLLIALAMTASAHEHREVGDYELTVGFSVEPALINEPNGLSLAVQVGTEDDGPPVEGLQETLEAEVTYAGETKPLELRARFGQPGSYIADVFPTAEGAYTFRIFGTIEGMEIDESFTSGPETFSEVESTDEIAFPAGAAGDDSGAAVTEAQDAADSARTLAIIGITLSVISLAAVAGGVIGVMKAARAGRASTGPVTRQADDESG